MSIYIIGTPLALVGLMHELKFIADYYVVVALVDCVGPPKPKVKHFVRVLQLPVLFSSFLRYRAISIGQIFS